MDGKAVNQTCCKKRRLLLDVSDIQGESSSIPVEGIPQSIGEEQKGDFGYVCKHYNNKRQPFKEAKDCLLSLKASVECLCRKNLFPYNPEVLLKRANGETSVQCFVVKRSNIQSPFELVECQVRDEKPDTGDRKVESRVSSHRSLSYMDTKSVFGNDPDNPPTVLVLVPSYMASRPFPIYSSSETENAAIVTQEKYGSVRRVYIVCDQENDPRQTWMIGNNPVDEVMVISGSDQMAMISKPQELCSCLLEIGDEYM
ncbi:unnamed protein product [Dovyalis caffra]|uniref:Protein Lines C-terminal domain-containing protein n=1 Tax=Dovyalis caffra TaxID=77055 RepID=A0AAV1RVV1_9ROSI|nr:unnamed protein product [Dovyalis caffra]